MPSHTGSAIYSRKILACKAIGIADTTSVILKSITSYTRIIAFITQGHTCKTVYITKPTNFILKGISWFTRSTVN